MRVRNLNVPLSERRGLWWSRWFLIPYYVLGSNLFGGLVAAGLWPVAAIVALSALAVRVRYGWPPFASMGNVWAFALGFIGLIAAVMVGFSLFG